MNLHHHHALESRNESKLLRSLDPRGTLIGTLLCVIAISLVHWERAAWVALFLVGPLLLCTVSGLGALRALWRASVVLPFVLLPLLLRPWALDVSWGEALSQALGVGVKAWSSAVLLVLLVSLAPLPALCRAATRLGVPEVLTQTILLIERYMRLLRARFAAMMLSARLRGFSLRRGQGKVVGMMAGSLLLRTMDRSERVYVAMKARGYNGAIPSLEEHHFRGRDVAVILLSLGWSIGLLAASGSFAWR